MTFRSKLSAAAAEFVPSAESVSGAVLAGALPPPPRESKVARKPPLSYAEAAGKARKTEPSNAETKQERKPRAFIAGKTKSKPKAAAHSFRLKIAGTERSLTLAFLFEQIGLVDAPCVALCQQIAEKNRIYLKGGFAIHALVCSLAQAECNPLCVRDFDAEVHYRSRDHVETLLRSHRLEVTNDIPGTHFFNANFQMLSKSIEAGFVSYPCEFTFVDNEYCSYDPFHWTQLRLGIDKNGAIFCPAGQRLLFEKVKKQFQEKGFGINWYQFENEPAIDKGLARLMKYLYQIEFSHFSAWIRTGDGVPQRSIKKYLSNRVNLRSLCRDLAELTKLYVNISKTNELESTPPAWLKHNNKWLSIIADGAMLVITEAAKRQELILNEKACKDVWSALLAEIESRSMRDAAFRFPAMGMTPTFMGVILESEFKKFAAIHSPNAATPPESKEGPSASAAARVSSSETLSASAAARVSSGEALFSHASAAKSITTEIDNPKTEQKSVAKKAP